MQACQAEKQWGEWYTGRLQPNRGRPSQLRAARPRVGGNGGIVLAVVSVGVLARGDAQPSVGCAGHVGGLHMRRWRSSPTARCALRARLPAPPPFPSHRVPRRLLWRRPRSAQRDAPQLMLPLCWSAPAPCRASPARAPVPAAARSCRRGRAAASHTRPASGRGQGVFKGWHAMATDCVPGKHRQCGQPAEQSNPSSLPAR